MVKEDFISLLENSAKINQAETNEIKNIIAKYPYFQSARVLFLKGLKNQESFRYNNELKITSAFTQDRTLLFDFITSDDFNAPKKETIHEKIIEKITVEKTEEINQEIEDVKQDLSIGKPLTFYKNETHSFTEWLQLSTKKPVDRKIYTKNKTITKDVIIDKLINENPKIIP